MSRAIIVSNQAACVRWLMLNLSRVDDVWDEFDETGLLAGDCVYGNLSLENIESLIGRGVRYFQIRFGNGRYFRDQPLDDRAWSDLQPELVEFGLAHFARPAPHWLG